MRYLHKADTGGTVRSDIHCTSTYREKNAPRGPHLGGEGGKYIVLSNPQKVPNLKERGCKTSEHYEGGGFLLTVFEISTSGFLQSSSIVGYFIILKAS